MRITQTDVNIAYPQINDYRKKFILYEDVLSKNFNQANVLPIPEDVQAEIPRIVTQTKYGHSVFNIALTRASFTTGYTDSYQTDWNLCRRYIEQRCGDVYQIIDELTDGNESYVGLICQIEYYELEEKSLDVLKRSFLKNNATALGNLQDVQCKLTYVYKDKYYINITLVNVDGNNNDVIEEDDNFIGIILEVNDRYEANRNPAYTSNKDSFDSILAIASDIITNKLDDLITKGEFVYGLEETE